MSCAVGPPVDYGSCAEGSQPKSEADSALLKSFHATLETMLRTSALNIMAYDETKKCLAKMFADSCAPEAFTKALTAVDEAHQQGYPTGDSCDQACNTLGEWYDKSSCKEGLKKTTVIAKCKLACMAPEWGQ
jgi:hypothetical protein